MTPPVIGQSLQAKQVRPPQAAPFLRAPTGQRVHPGTSLAQELRNGRIQALHTGHAVLLDRDGATIQAWGDPDTPTYWRSAPKPLQAIPFVEVMDELGYDELDLALACASHSSEPRHVDRARAMLERAGLTPDALRCGTHPPMTRHAGPEPNGGWTSLHNNCSGKHAAMLAVCKHHGWPLQSYQDPDYPLQQHIQALVREATGADEVPVGVDGCGLPTFWQPISGLARAYQWLDQHPHGGRALDAMATHPGLVAGKDRFCTDLMVAGGGDLVGKVGAAGVYVVLHRKTGEALAVKATAGSDRAVETFVANAARERGWVAQDALAAFAKRGITDCRGNEIGSWSPA